MDEILRVFLSWQFLLVGIVVYFIFKFFNDFLAPLLWKEKKLRSVIKFFEGSKMVYPPLIGFGLGSLPNVPRPGPLMESDQLTVAMLYLVAGLFCQSIVKGVRKALESKGIDVGIDLSPREQSKRSVG